MRLSEHLARLEQRQHRIHGPCAFDSVEAAQAAGVRGGRRLCALVLRGPDKLADLAAARASGCVAELNTPKTTRGF